MCFAKTIDLVYSVSALLVYCGWNKRIVENVTATESPSMRIEPNNLPAIRADFGAVVRDRYQHPSIVVLASDIRAPGLAGLVQVAFVSPTPQRSHNTMDGIQ